MSDNDIYFKNHGTQSGKNSKYTERITPEQLNAPVGNHALGNIKNTNEVPQKNSKSEKPAPKKKKKSTPKIIAISIICTLLIIISIGIVAAMSGISYVLGDYTEAQFSDNEYVTESDLIYSNDVTNILLIGMDNYNSGNTTRSDTMILVSVDKKNKTIKLTSFLRDTYSEIPGHGWAKLNAACTYGGAQLVCDSIEYNLGIRIDGYVMTGYDIFTEIIDAVDGITIPDIDETEAKAMAAEGVNITPGENIYLNSKEALVYCRIRKGQDDFYRTSRQREVITLVIQKALKTNPVKLIKAAREICSKITCSLSKSDILSLGINCLSCLTSDIEQFRVPADGTWYNDTKNYQAVLVTDFSQNTEQLKDFLYAEKRGEQ